MHRPPGELVGDPGDHVTAPVPHRSLELTAEASELVGQPLDVLPGARPFEAEPFGRQAALVYFAVIDATAAVGLWLTSAWGGVLWLLAVTSAVTLALLVPQLVPAPMPIIVAEVSIVLIYFLLSWFAARELR